MSFIEINGVRQDPPRKVAMKRLMVTLAPWQASQVLPGGVLIETKQKGQPSEHEVTVYADDAEKIKALVHTDMDGLERAREAFEAKSKEHDDELRAAGVDPSTRLIPNSVEAEYREFRRNRDVLPLIGVREIATLPAPEAQRGSENADVIAKAVASALAETMPGIIAAVSESLAKQQNNRK